MNSKTLLLSTALLASMALRAQTSTPGTPAGQNATPSAPSGQGANAKRLDDDPMFQKLTPEQQAWARQINDRLNKAVAQKDDAVGQLAVETAKPAQNPANTPLHYVYTATASNNAPAPTAPPAKPAASSPCEVTPRKPGFFDRLKQHAKQTLQKQADKADAQIAKASKGNVDGGVKDATTTAINQADQQNPCPPAKSQSAKQ